MRAAVRERYTVRDQEARDFEMIALDREVRCDDDDVSRVEQRTGSDKQLYELVIAGVAPARNARSANVSLCSSRSEPFGGCQLASALIPCSCS